MYILRLYDQGKVDLYLCINDNRYLIDEFVLNPSDYSITFTFIIDNDVYIKKIYDVSLYQRMRGYGHNYKRGDD